MSNKKVKMEKKETNRGKPENIKQTHLDAPQIWTNYYESSSLIKLFYEKGRHVSVHQAGKDGGKKALKEKKLQMKQNADCYEIAQNIAIQLFQIPKTQKRLTVFFFRLPNEECCEINQIPNLDEKLALVLQQIYFLFRKNFINDFIKIAQSYDIDIVDELLKDKRHPHEYSQLFQNAYITNIIEKMKFENLAQIYGKMNIKQLKEDFKKFVNDEQTKNYINDFVKEIKQILNSNNNCQTSYYNYYNQDYDIQDQFINDDVQSYEHSQYLLLDAI